MIDEKQVLSVIRASINEQVGFDMPEQPIGHIEMPSDEEKGTQQEAEVQTEAYVASPKTYSQVSEMVSDKTKDAHIQTYQGYIEKLNKVSAELDTANRQEANSSHSSYRSLKLDEAHLHNAVYLHELYFANCFDPHSEVFMDALAFLRFERDFGNFENWQKDFMACAMSAREGWAVCGYSMFLKRFVNTFVDAHSLGAMAGFIPVLVLDVWSHAYFRDYLEGRKSYVTAMMREINWEIVEERVKKVDAINKVNR